jgi:hypothetical protein
VTIAERCCAACGGALGERQRWCLACGAAASRLAPAPRRTAALGVGVAAVALLALAAIGYAVAALVS